MIEQLIDAIPPFRSASSAAFNFFQIDSMQICSWNNFHENTHSSCHHLWSHCYQLTPFGYFDQTYFLLSQVSSRGRYCNRLLSQLLLLWPKVFKKSFTSTAYMAQGNKVEIFKLSEILSKLDNINSYFLTLLNSNSSAIGLIRLKRGQKDNQQPHTTDELYYVILTRRMNYYRLSDLTRTLFQVLFLLIV